MTTNEQPEFIEPPKPLAPQGPGKPRDTKRILWNVLTLGVLMLTLCACCYFLAVFASPNSPLNPFPPEEPVTLLVLPTATWTPLSLGATWTPSATPPPVQQPTLRPTFTPVFTNTPPKLYTDTPTETATPTETYTPSPEPTGVPFTVTVKYVDSSIMHPESACDFFGVGGSVFDLQDNPFKGMVVKLEGAAGGKFYSQLTVSGTAPAYGQSGFEFVLGSKPVDSSGSMTIQLLDQAGLPLSGVTAFDTYADCTKNLPIVRFEQIR
jgi:hypothetical protein